MRQIKVAEILRGARAFVQHSLTASCGDSEGTPVAILEAQASRLPVISTFHKGITDTVLDGKTGLLSEEGNVQQMADNMLLLAKDPVLAGRMGYEARDHALLHYSIQKSISSLDQIIRNVI